MTTRASVDQAGEFWNQSFPPPTTNDNVYRTDGFEYWWADDITPEMSPVSNEAMEGFFGLSRSTSSSYSPSLSRADSRQTSAETIPTTSSPYKALKFIPEDVKSPGSLRRSDDDELQRKQRRREQNRRAQQNYKQRKDQQLQELSLQLAEMRDKYGRCAEQCVSLSTELAVIRSTLARMVSGDGSAGASTTSL